MQWTLREKIGKGGNGIVFRASSAEYPQAAVKLLTSFRGDHFSRFETEIRALKACQGENIVPIFDSGYLEYQGKPTPFYAMPVYTTNLRSLINRNPNGFGIEICLYFFEKLLAALAIMHSNGILHRDIKPENILIDDLGSPYFGDFGLAKAYSKKAQHILGYGLTRTSNKAAPVNYMSPEQLMYIHDKNVILDERSDLFQMGKVFYECLTGNNPLGQVSSPSEDDREHLFRHIVSPLIRQNPDERPKTAQGILDKLFSLRLYRIDKTKILTSGELIWAETTNRPRKYNALISDSKRVVWHYYDWDRYDVDTHVKPLDQNVKFVYPLFDIIQGYCIGYCSVVGNYPEQKLVCSVLNEKGGISSWSKDFELIDFTPNVKEFVSKTSAYFEIRKFGVLLQKKGIPEEFYIIGELALDILVIRINLLDNVISYKTFFIPGYHPQYGQSLDSIASLSCSWLNGIAKIDVNAFFYNQGDGGGPTEVFNYEYKPGSDVQITHATENIAIKLPEMPYRTHNLIIPTTPSFYSPVLGFGDSSLSLDNKVLRIFTKNKEFPDFSLSISNDVVGVLVGDKELNIYRKSNLNFKVDSVIRVLPLPPYNTG